MTTMFFYGTLCHLPLLETVLGHPIALIPGHLPGFRVARAKDRPHPMITADPKAQTPGFLARNLSPTDIDRLNFYEGGFAFTTISAEVTTQGGAEPALIYLPDPGHWEEGGPWSLSDWQAEFGAVLTETAADVMALYGKADPAQVLRRYGNMLVRGASRLRAKAAAAPSAIRHPATAADVDLRHYSQPYAHFFAVEEYNLSFRRFNGTPSRIVNRAAFVAGDAVTVLPYDPQRDRVLVVEQFRAAPYARGDRNPWQIEAIAGRIDPFETPEQAAIREAQEEAALTLGPLHLVSEYYPSPGAVTEYLYSYVAICDLPDGAAGVFGVADEAEDIRGHLLGFDQMMELITSGEIQNAPLILTALWLQRERPRLRTKD